MKKETPPEIKKALEEKNIDFLLGYFLREEEYLIALLQVKLKK